MFQVQVEGPLAALNGSCFGGWKPFGPLKITGLLAFTGV